LRVPLLFSEGVRTGRLDLNRFVALTATNHARLYGLYPRKGTIAVGSDADIAIWDPGLEVEVSASMLHDQTGYTPYEGRRGTEGRGGGSGGGGLVVDGGKLVGGGGSGVFLPCAVSDAAKPAGNPVPELAFTAAQRGAPLV